MQRSHLNKSTFSSKKYIEYKSDYLPVRSVFPEKNNNTNILADYPTTLEVIEDIINYKSELSEDEKDIYRSREINNFQVVIERLMERENFRNKVKFLCN